MKKVAVVTGSRAEYGLLKPLIAALDEECLLTLVVTGSHLSPRFGDNHMDLPRDAVLVRGLLDDDTHVGVSTSMGLTLAGMSQAFTNISPDVVVVTGDRYEMLAAALAIIKK